MKRLLMYVIPLSAVAVLVFATIAVAQGIPQGQEPSQNPATGHTTDAQTSTTWPAKNKPAETSTPTETSETIAPTETADTTTPTQTTVPDPNGQKTVNIYNHAFDPAQLNVASGTTVRFVNRDTEPHTATADNNLFDTGVLEPGGSFKVYFEGAGTVTYRDTLSPAMVGSLIVGEEDTAPQTREAAEAEEEAEEEADNESSSEADQIASEAAPPLKG